MIIYANWLQNFDDSARTRHFASWVLNSFLEYSQDTHSVTLVREVAHSMQTEPVHVLQKRSSEKLSAREQPAHVDFISLKIVFYFNVQKMF